MKRRRSNRPKMALDDPRRKNLIPAKKGEVRNPTGKNGSEALSAFRAFASEVVTETVGKKRITAERAALVRAALFRNAIRGETRAQQIFIEHDEGRPRQRVELTGEGGKPLVPTDAGALDMLRKLVPEKPEG